MKTVILIFVILLSGCTQPNPVTDAQMKLITDMCKEAGGVVSIFNSNVTSRADCVKSPVDKNQ